ncbi:hypothetical protein [Paenibacillus jiagnxiensis]|uniref:hypothetical protein n=1 Tax=Paenibacillus jiagnxiensis TaxID=3228926 RepID=UPI0033B2F6F0
MEPKLEDVTNWLNGHTNRSILIHKVESGNEDDVRMKLERAAVHSDSTHAIDDYTGGNVLCLYGKGTVINGQEELPLPQNAFLIPAAGIHQTGINDHSVQLSTERAQYSILLV